MFLRNVSLLGQHTYVDTYEGGWEGWGWSWRRQHLEIRNQIVQMTEFTAVMTSTSVHIGPIFHYTRTK